MRIVCQLNPDLDTINDWAKDCLVDFNPTKTTVKPV